MLPLWHKLVLFPGKRGLKAQQMCVSSQAVISIISVSSSLSALLELAAPSQLSCLLLVSYSASSASSQDQYAASW